VFEPLGNREVVGGGLSGILDISCTSNTGDPSLCDAGDP
jgi:hypothetical protein